MNPTPDRRDPDASIPDDILAARVRSAVDGWTMPPQRLDQPTWRDRVGRRTVGGGRGWGARLGGAAVAAVAVTLTAALAAVWLTASPPRQGVAAPPSASPSASNATPPAIAATTPLPTLAVNGELPDPSRIVVRNNGLFRVADLSTGRLGELMTSNLDGPTSLFPRPGGGWLCVCGDWLEFSGNRPTGVAITLQTANAAGEPDAPVLLREAHAQPDPAGTMDAELVDVTAHASPDGALAFVAWNVRNGSAGWTGGIDVVDLASATVVSSTPLTFPDPEAAGGDPTSRAAPDVSLSPSGDTVLVSSPWWVANGLAFPPSATQFWTAPFDGRTIGPLTAAFSSPPERCDTFYHGLIDDSRVYLGCLLPNNNVAIERTRLDGTVIDSTPVPGQTSGLSGFVTVVRRGDQLYLWDARSSTLSRFDLMTARADSTTATAAVPSTGPLDAVAALGRDLGRWIAPPVLAKEFLDPGMVVSPDGSRIYGLGLEGVGPDGAGSRGVFVFDARTLENVGHWAPTADFQSIAINSDGRYVYAAGQPSRDATGATIVTGASVTVFDTRDGSVRLIAGQLDFGPVTFPSGFAQ